MSSVSRDMCRRMTNVTYLTCMALTCDPYMRQSICTGTTIRQLTWLSHVWLSRETNPWLFYETIHQNRHYHTAAGMALTFVALTCNQSMGTSTTTRYLTCVVHLPLSSVRCSVCCSELQCVVCVVEWHMSGVVCKLIERNPPPWGGSYLLCFLIKNCVYEDPPRRTWYKSFEGGPLTHGS